MNQLRSNSWLNTWLSTCPHSKTSGKIIEALAYKADGLDRSLARHVIDSWHYCAHRVIFFLWTAHPDYSTLHTAVPWVSAVHPPNQRTYRTCMHTGTAVVLLEFRWSERLNKTLSVHIWWALFPCVCRVKCCWAFWRRDGSHWDQTWSDLLSEYLMKNQWAVFEQNPHTWCWGSLQPSEALLFIGHQRMNDDDWNSEPSDL